MPAAACAPRGSRSSATASPSSTTACPSGPTTAPSPAVVALGRIAEQRRPAATARILAALAADARVGWIGGSGDGDDGAVRDAGIPVTGWLPHSEALERLAEATVYLHWSAWDGQSLAILEAIARDVVVVASDIPANREIVGPRQVCTDERSADRARAIGARGPRAARRAARGAAPPRPRVRRAPDVRGMARCLRANAAPGLGRRACNPRQPHSRLVRSESHGPEGPHRPGLETPVGRARRLRHHGHREHAGHPLPPDGVRVDRGRRAHPRRRAGPGAGRLRQPVGAAGHLRRDGQVEHQPRARSGGPRPRPRRGHRHLHRGRQRHPAHHRARDRRRATRPPRRRRPPRRSRTRSPATS